MRLVSIRYLQWNDDQTIACIPSPKLCVIYNKHSPNNFQLQRVTFKLFDKLLHCQLFTIERLPQLFYIKYTKSIWFATLQTNLLHVVHSMNQTNYSIYSTRHSETKTFKANVIRIWPKFTDVNSKIPLINKCWVTEKFHPQLIHNHK